MGIFDYFRHKKPVAQVAEQPKEVEVKPQTKWAYNPKAENVRIDNIANATGKKPCYVSAVAQKCGVAITKQGRRTFVSRDDALKLFATIKEADEKK